MYYKLTMKDFRKAFDFSVQYYLDPSKSKSGRTTGEPRGLGGIIDSFFSGKLIEIGVAKILDDLGPKKHHIDLKIKKTLTASKEPDIISITEKKRKRSPKLFIEIKNSSRGYWLGLDQKQLNTLKSSSKGKEIFIVYASHETNFSKNNFKTGDYLGMFLKKITSPLYFKEFANLNGGVKLDFIISIDELEKYGTKFLKGDFMLETNLFEDKTSFVKTSKGVRKGIKSEKIYDKFSGKMCVPFDDGSEDARVGEFKITGSFEILKKYNYKTQQSYIAVKKNTIIKNNVFGRYKLEKEKVYSFLLKKAGRNPELKVDNVFISKNIISQIIKDRKIPNLQKRLKDITQGI